MLVEVDGVGMPGNPVKLADHEDSYRAAPALGEHTDAVLAELLGLDASEVAGLRERGVVG
jgi:crotonobetainyl-CoA:carnitine CoA-transferase CaiB-like acyl-CoA transferase